MEKQEHNLLINIKDLTWTYPNNPYLLFKNFSLALYKGQFLILQGNSGAGKSTLVKILTLDIKLPPKTFYYKLDDIYHFSFEERQKYRKKAGFITQKPLLFDEQSVYENIVYPLVISEIPEELYEEKFITIAKKLNLLDKQEVKVKFLSEGEKQKVVLARTLIKNPEFIVADEPTASLDREDTRKYADLLVEYYSINTAVLLATHDLHIIEYLKHRLKDNLDIQII